MLISVIGDEMLLVWCDKEMVNAWNGYIASTVQVECERFERHCIMKVFDFFDCHIFPFQLDSSLAIFLFNSSVSSRIIRRNERLMSESMSWRTTSIPATPIRTPKK